jgi:hypothetical protein
MQPETVFKKVKFAVCFVTFALSHRLESVCSMLIHGCTWLKSRNSRTDCGFFCSNPIAPGETQFCSYHAVTKPPLSHSLWAAVVDEAARWVRMRAVWTAGGRAGAAP